MIRRRNSINGSVTPLTRFWKVSLTVQLMQPLPIMRLNTGASKKAERCNCTFSMFRFATREIKQTKTRVVIQNVVKMDVEKEFPLVLTRILMIMPSLLERLWIWWTRNVIARMSRKCFNSYSCPSLAWQTKFRPAQQVERENWLVVIIIPWHDIHVPGILLDCPTIM